MSRHSVFSLHKRAQNREVFVICLLTLTLASKFIKSLPEQFFSWFQNLFLQDYHMNQKLSASQDLLGIPAPEWDSHGLKNCWILGLSIRRQPFWTRTTACNPLQKKIPCVYSWLGYLSWETCSQIITHIIYTYMYMCVFILLVLFLFENPV